MLAGDVGDVGGVLSDFQASRRCPRRVRLVVKYNRTK